MPQAGGRAAVAPLFAVRQKKRRVPSSTSRTQIEDALDRHAIGVVDPEIVAYVGVQCARRSWGNGADHVGRGDPVGAALPAAAEVCVSGGDAARSESLVRVHTNAGVAGQAEAQSRFDTYGERRGQATIVAAVGLLFLNDLACRALIRCASSGWPSAAKIQRATTSPAAPF